MKKIVLFFLISTFFIFLSGKAEAQHSKTSGIDKATGSQTVIDYPHHETHGSSGFFYTDSATLASGVSTSYVIQTPDTTKWAHLTFAASGNAITTVDIYESVDLTGTGAKQTIYNSNRNSSAPSGLGIWDAIAPGTVGGTLIWKRSSGSATQQSRVGLSAEHNGEIILKQNTRYMIRITSGTNANLTNLQLEWYEHTDKVKTVE